MNGGGGGGEFGGGGGGGGAGTADHSETCTDSKQVVRWVGFILLCHQDSETCMHQAVSQPSTSPAYNKSPAPANPKHQHVLNAQLDHGIGQGPYLHGGFGGGGDGGGGGGGRGGGGGGGLQGSNKIVRTMASCELSGINRDSSTYVGGLGDGGLGGGGGSGLCMAITTNLSDMCMFQHEVYVYEGYTQFITSKCQALEQHT